MTPIAAASMLRSPRMLLAGLALFGLLVIGLWYGGQHKGLQPYFHKNGDSSSAALDFNASPKRLEDVRNSTLGFEEVFVINLSSRPDRLDGFSLAASLTGFNARVIEGVKGEEVANKTLPSLENLPTDPSARNNVVGCLRAHLNAAREIVDRGLSSVLIMEDDSDWDVSLKEQLRLFAQGSQYVTDVKENEVPHSPYGDDWDLIWPGHCASQIEVNDQKRFLIENDDTVPPPFRRVNFSKDLPDMSPYSNSSRIVYKAGSGICLYAYALSHRGAAKLLFGSSMMTRFQPIDLAIGDKCRDDDDFKCVGVFPQIIDSHKGAGRTNRDSDIGGPKKDVRKSGYTFNIVHSTRLNMARLLAGKGAAIERQWPDDPLIEGPAVTRTLGRTTPA